MLHSRRHRTVLRLVLNAKRPQRILVVCHANLCRSPYLAAVLQHVLPDAIVTSAGFVGADRDVPPESVMVSGQRGFDLSRSRSRPLTQAAVDAADLVVVMDTTQKRDLLRLFRTTGARVIVAADLDPVFQGSRAIEDPWDQSTGVFEYTFDRLDRCAAALVGILQHTA
ncbi:MAG TPA: hypothetical protein VJ840_05580 [Gemmatimonadaceae bacterium]|nr:hypothetical protein [Gemmatimonadaceae bacterium]